MKYFYLHEIDNGENVALQRETHTFFNPRSGDTISAEEIDGDICFSLTAGADHGYDQFDPNFTGEVKDLTLQERMLDYYDHDSLFSQEFIDILDEYAKADFQAFSVKIKNKFNHEQVEKTYKLVNITQSFSMEDIQSTSNTVSAENYYSLTINESAIASCPIFRLKPIGVIIVNEILANAVNNSALKGVKAFPLNT